MSNLYPTPTRLALLRYVARYWVYQHPDGRSYMAVAHRQQVTARIAELEGAGWVRIDPGDYTVRYWDLTDAGRAVLDAHGGQS